MFDILSGFLILVSSCSDFIYLIKFPLIYMLDCRVLKIPTVSKASNSCCSYSRCSSTEMSWRTTTRSLMPISCPLNLMEKVPSTMARPQQPSCSTKCPASLCANQAESRYILQNPHRLSRLKAHCSGVGGRKKSNE